MIACFTENQLQNTEKIILLRSVIVLLSMSPKGKTKTRAWHMTTDNTMLPTGKTKTRAWHMTTDNTMLPKGKTKTWHMTTDNTMLPKRWD